MLDANTLPNDVASLKRLVIERDREIEHLKLQLAKLRRWKFGESSEPFEAGGQLLLTLEELKAAVTRAALESGANNTSAHTAAGETESLVPEKKRPTRRDRRGRDRRVPRLTCEVLRSEYESAE